MQGYHVKRNLDIAYEMLKDTTDSVELWVATGMCPDALLLDEHPPNVTNAVSIRLGPITRQSRSIVGEDDITITNKEGITVVIPYSAIYCLAAPAEYSRMMGWNLHVPDPSDEDQRSYAFVNLETEQHAEYLK